MLLANREFLRQGLHFFSGFGAFLLYYCPRPTVLLLVALGVGLIVAVHFYVNRKRLPAIPMYRDGESLWKSGAIRYAVGVAIAIAVFPREHAFMGWIVLAAGDSASTIVGRTWPLHRLYNAHSIGGFIAFFAASMIATLLGSCWWNGTLSTNDVIRMTGVSACCATAELFITQLDDNYYLPSLAAAVILITSISSG